jgi:hypothetical protein
MQIKSIIQNNPTMAFDVQEAWVKNNYISESVLNERHKSVHFNINV